MEDKFQNSYSGAWPFNNNNNKKTDLGGRKKAKKKRGGGSLHFLLLLLVSRCLFKPNLYRREQTAVSFVTQKWTEIQFNNYLSSEMARKLYSGLLKELFQEIVRWKTHKTFWTLFQIIISVFLKANHTHIHIWNICCVKIFPEKNRSAYTTAF